MFISVALGYRLYSSAVYNDSFPDYTPPEIVRKPVEDLVLQLKMLNIDRLANFPFPTCPDLAAIEVAEELLVQLNALDARSPTKSITDLGRRMAMYPINPRYAKMLIIAQEKRRSFAADPRAGRSVKCQRSVAQRSCDDRQSKIAIKDDVIAFIFSQNVKLSLDDYRRQWVGQVR